MHNQLAYLISFPIAVYLDISHYFTVFIYQERYRKICFIHDSDIIIHHIKYVMLHIFPLLIFSGNLKYVLEIFVCYIDELHLFLTPLVYRYSFRNY